MPQSFIDHLDDPRLEPYRNLKHTNRTRWTGQFVCEGEKLARRLLESRFPAHSVLVDRQHLPRLEPLFPPELDVFVVPDNLVSEIVGFNFHRGVLACGLRAAEPELAEIAGPKEAAKTLVVCPDVQDPENLGTIARTSLALGIDGLILGPKCGDPFSRRVLRVSMGAVLRLPIRRCHDLEAELEELKGQWSFELSAAVLADDAKRLDEARRPHRLALLFGNEGLGLSSECIAACQSRITIPMHPAADSLNVSVAVGVFLYHFLRGSGTR